MNKSQLKALSEFLNNVAAGWFIAGVIAALFTKDFKTQEILLSILLGLTTSIIFLLLSLGILKEEK